MDRTTTVCSLPRLPLRLYGWFSPEALREAQRMVEPWYTRPLRAFAFCACALLLVVVVVLGILAFAALLPTGWKTTSLAQIGVIPGFVLASIIGAKFAHKDLLRSGLLDVGNPHEIVLRPEGLETIDRRGSRCLLPWSAFSGFRQGTRVTLLRHSPQNYYRPIAVEFLSAEKCAALHTVLSGYLPNLDPGCPAYPQSSESPLVS